MSTTISIRLSDAERRAIEEYAEFNGENISTAFKKALLEKVEDWEDLLAAREAYKEYVKNPKTYTMEEMMQEFVYGK